MPYASKAQQGFMHAAAKRGQIKPSVVREYDNSTNFKTLPAKVRKPRGNIRRMILERLA